jgi:hypothetical protein
VRIPEVNSIILFSAPANFSLLQETEKLAIASGNTTGISFQVGKKEKSLFTVNCLSGAKIVNHSTSHG